MSKFWNFVKNQDAPTVELRIDGDIVPDDDAWMYEWFGMSAASPNAFRDELSQYAGQDITLWVDSFGGDVFAAAGIFNALKSHNGKITAKITKAMSAASVISMAADEVLMSEVGIMMIQNPLTGVFGDMRDLRQRADVLDTVKDTIINAYAAKTNKSRSFISALMDDETYMSADDAVKNGFADGIIGREEKEVGNIANFSFSRFAIVNSANESMKQLMNFQESRKEPEVVNQDKELEKRKENILKDLDLI